MAFRRRGGALSGAWARAHALSTFFLLASVLPTSSAALGVGKSDAQYRQDSLVYAGSASLPAGRDEQAGPIAALKGSAVLGCKPGEKTPICAVVVPDVALWAERRVRGQDLSGAPDIAAVARAVAALQPAGACDPGGPQSWSGRDQRIVEDGDMRATYIVASAPCATRARGFYRYLFFASLYVAAAEPAERAAAAGSIAALRSVARGRAKFDPGCGVWSARPAGATCALSDDGLAFGVLRTASLDLLADHGAVPAKEIRRRGDLPAPEAALSGALWPRLAGGADLLFLALTYAKASPSDPGLAEACASGRGASPEPTYQGALERLAETYLRNACPPRN